MRRESLDGAPPPHVTDWGAIWPYERLVAVVREDGGDADAAAGQRVLLRLAEGREVVGGVAGPPEKLGVARADGSGDAS